MAKEKKIKNDLGKISINDKPDNSKRNNMIIGISILVAFIILVVILVVLNITKTYRSTLFGRLKSLDSNLNYSLEFVPENGNNDNNAYRLFVKDNFVIKQVSSDKYVWKDMKTNETVYKDGSLIMTVTSSNFDNLSNRDIIEVLETYFKDESYSYKFISENEKIENEEVYKIEFEKDSEKITAWVSKSKGYPIRIEHKKGDEIQADQGLYKIEYGKVTDSLVMKPEN